MLSRQSQDKLNTCHPDLIRIVEKAVRILESKNLHITLSVLEGTRDEKTQNEYFEKGVSKLRYPHSKHNQNPSLAVDIKPDRVGWTTLKDKAAFYRLAGMIEAIAFYEGVGIRWGGDWDMDNDLTDQTFDDLPHFELFA